MTYSSVLFIGCGNMGGAMLDGWLAGGIDPATFTVMDPNREAVPAGVALVRDLPDSCFDAVLLGVKPHMLADLAPAVRRVISPATTVFSVLAGVELATLARHFPDALARVRVMPNLAAQLGKSPIALVAGALEDQDRAEVDALYAHLGHVEWLADEDLFDLVTALAGSGPGFVYRFIDALASGAAALGLPHDQAERLAVAMVEGASALAAASQDSPAELARRVASPGGVTQVGLDILDHDDALAKLIEDTLRGARDRSAEMAARARDDG